MPPYFFPITNMRDLTKKKSHIRKTTGKPVAGILSIKAPVNCVNFLLFQFSFFWLVTLTLRNNIFVILIAIQFFCCPIFILYLNRNGVKMV